MISNRADQAVTPFILHFAQRLPPTPAVLAAVVNESAGPSVTLLETRFTKVVAETTDDA